ncbi:hypothetical protein M408DRAFT_224434 [Serendipita vermifera MAFF 305830]|uniref:Uncharacterized protein n=1 Tax=Serendipita vermifera MAFF 305830 TaxID=933852 RepID=A0A0C2WEQ7_SERVB|nr:hypothetical protein M408DRAFT_224434 [Serendipita vermifera MAFF 305830]
MHAVPTSRVVSELKVKNSVNVDQQLEFQIISTLCYEDSFLMNMQKIRDSCSSDTRKKDRIVNRG